MKILPLCLLKEKMLAKVNECQNKQERQLSFVWYENFSFVSISAKVRDWRGGL